MATTRTRTVAAVVVYAHTEDTEYVCVCVYISPQGIPSPWLGFDRNEVVV